MRNFNDFLARIDISAIFDYLARDGRMVRYAKGDSLVQQGSRCRHIGVVQSGYFKFAVTNSKGQEIITAFSCPGNLITDYVHSFMCDTPSPTSIIAGSDAVVLQGPIQDVRRFLGEHDPAFENNAMTHLLTEAYARYLDVHVLSPAERYQKLREQYPAFVETLPVQEVASYLGVSRRQLHRIRVAAGLESD